MKKAYLIFCLAFLAIASCDKGIVSLDEINSNSGDIVFNLSANHPNESGTKAVKTGWETNDVIYVLFSNQSAPSYLKMTRNGSGWVYTPMNSLNLAENETGTMTAIYLPFGNDANITSDGSTYKFDSQYYSYYLTAQLPYTVTEGTVSGTFDMRIPGGYVQFFLDYESASPSTEIELREPHLTPQGILSIAADGAITHTSAAHGAPLKGYVYDKEVKETGESKGYLFSGVLATEAQGVSTDYDFTLVIGGWNGNYYNKTFENQSFYRGAAVGRALKLPNLSNWAAITTHKPIDMGTNVNGKRIYWSNLNLGASFETDYGDYYAWGELVPYYEDGHSQDNPCSSWRNNLYLYGYSWSSYKWSNGALDQITKYCPQNMTEYWDESGEPDNKIELDQDDDPARLLGGKWRMPTDEELMALRSKCSWMHNSPYAPYSPELNGFEGWVVIAPFSDNRRIFLPAAGKRENTNIYNVESRGTYWSSSLYTENPNEAWVISFSNNVYHAYASRYVGYSIRPVSD